MSAIDSRAYQAGILVQANKNVATITNLPRFGIHHGRKKLHDTGPRYNLPIKKKFPCQFPVSPSLWQGRINYTNSQKFSPKNAQMFEPYIFILKKLLIQTIKLKKLRFFLPVKH
jgi:hypothetical protein